MPDHIHLLWLGIDDHRSEQLSAIEFLRRHLRPAIAPVQWQHQAYDHVLRQHERTRGAFASTAHYIRENPVRASLVAKPKDYPFLGCCLPGYPEIDANAEDYWERFWRIHCTLVDPPLAGARGYAGLEPA